MVAPARRKKESSKLMTRLSVPVFALIVAIVVFFAAAASYLLIRLQNDHTLRMADQSLQFVHRNIRYQFDTMNNVAAYVLSNPSIDGLLESKTREVYDAVDDFFALRTNLENLSLLSLLNDIGSGDAIATSYAVSLALRPASGLYAMATDRFDPTPGIYKDGDLLREDWYRDLTRGGRKTVWWGQQTGSSGTAAAMLYSARTKTSIKDGRDVGIVIVGANTGSIRSAFENAPLEKGYHLLLDESDRVIYSERYGFLEFVGDMPYVGSLEGERGSSVEKIDGEKHRVMFETFENGWKLLTVVPESHFNQYAFAVAAIGAATAAVALSIAGFVFRRIVVRVTVPITRLVSAMHRPEVLEFKEALPEQRSGIYEVDELGEKFSSMLVALRGLIEKSFAEEMDRKQLQLDLLQARINPHFLYNTLDLINCRAIMAGDREASRIVRSLANVFRYSLNRGETWIALEDEIAQVEAYLGIQMMMMDRLSAEFRIPEPLLSAAVVHFSLQPLVENAIVHGFSERAGDCGIAIEAEREGDVLVLRVKDNGKGCQAAERNRQLREQSGGGAESGPGEERTGEGRRSGYGTLNVHRRIQLHCGEAYGLNYVETDAGTCVEARLPYRRMAGKRSEEVAAMYKMLIAEDVRTVRETLVHAIPWGKLGVTVIGAVGNGEEALDRLKDEEPDLLLTDIGMPRMDGLELIEAARARLPDIRCIILSGLSEFEHARQAIRLQVRDYVLKPVDPAEIERVVSKAVREIGREREAAGRNGGDGKTREEKLPHLAELLPPGEPLGNLKKKKLADQAVGYVREHYAVRELALSDVAAAVGLSEKYLNLIVKEVTGSTINHLIIRFRMEEAARLLKDPANRIYEICDTVGYADLDHFRESFKKHHGLTPTEYRNQYS